MLPHSQKIYIDLCSSSRRTLLWFVVRDRTSVISAEGAWTLGFL